MERSPIFLERERFFSEEERKLRPRSISDQDQEREQAPKK